MFGVSCYYLNKVSLRARLYIRKIYYIFRGGLRGKSFAGFLVYILRILFEKEGASRVILK